MHTGKLFISTALLLGGMALAVIIFASATTDAKTADESFLSRDSGTYLLGETLIDANHDGKNADLMLIDGSSEQLGKTSTQGVLEWSSNLTEKDCPNGNSGLQGQLVNGNAVIHTTNGDFLLVRFDKGISCTDSTTHTANINLEGKVIGGTGQFADASGALNVTSIAIPQIIVDEDNAILVGNIDAEMRGTIKTSPRSRHTTDTKIIGVR
jgi:hypothetical protein